MSQVKSVCRGRREPFVVLLPDAVVAVELRPVDAEELQQILKFPLAVVSGHDAAGCCCCRWCPLSTCAGSSPRHARRRPALGVVAACWTAPLSAAATATHCTLHRVAALGSMEHQCCGTSSFRFSTRPPLQLATELSRQWLLHGVAKKRPTLSLSIIFTKR